MFSLVIYYVYCNVFIYFILVICEPLALLYLLEIHKVLPFYILKSNRIIFNFELTVMLICRMK